VKQSRRSRLVPCLLAALLLGSCWTLPDGYQGDYSEFRAARAAAEAERAERVRLREEEHAAAKEKAAVEEVAPPAPEDEGQVPFVPVPPEAQGSQARIDEEIAHDVRQELAGEQLLDERRVSVSVEGGVVTLEGVVLNSMEATTAVFAASRVRGVKGVYDLLEFEPREVRGAKIEIAGVDFFTHEADEALRLLVWTDLDVQRNIEKQFARTPELDTSGITVEVERGLVVLSGYVTSARDRKAAADIARKAGGRGVRNEIQVQPAFEIVRPAKKSPS
jgi:osmotically-inducible protein OsmY